MKDRSARSWSGILVLVAVVAAMLAVVLLAGLAFAAGARLAGGQALSAASGRAPAPRGTFYVNNNASYATTASVTLNSAMTGATQMHFRDQGGTWTAWETYATTRAWRLPAGDGTKAVDAEYRSSDGKVAAKSDSIIVDTTPPVGSVLINAGAAFASSTGTTLTLSASDITSGVDRMCISNDGVFDTEPWESYATPKVWTLTSGDGLKTVYVRYRDRAGNTSGTVTDTIILDSTAPTGSVTINGGSTYTTSTAASLGITSNNATQMMISNDAAFAGASWESTAASKAWTLTAGDGTKTVYAKFRSAAGRESVVASDDIVLDTTPPTGSVAVNGGSTYTTSTAVNLTLTSSGATQMMVSNSSAFTGASWEATASSKSWTLTAGDGTKTVYVKFKDAAGNVSTTASATIILDTTPPTGSVTINGGSVYTTSTAVSLGIASGDAAQMMVSNSSAFTGASWEATASSKSWTLTAGDGTKTVYVRFKDAAGNVSTTASATIILDTIPPTGTVTINGGSAYATSTAVNLTLAAADAISGTLSMRISNDGVFDTEPWENYLTSKAWTLPVGDGSKTVSVQYRDRAGNISDSVADDITLDTQAPAGSFAINDGASWATTSAVSLDSTITDAAPIQMRFRNGGASWASWEVYSAHRAWTIWAPDETKTVEAEFRDAAGNTLMLSDDIRLETGPPAPLGGFAAARGDQQITLSWSNPRGDFSMARVLRSAIDYPSDPNPSSDQVIVYEGTWEAATDLGLVNGTQYFYAAFAMDDLGNWSAPATSTATPGEPAALVATGTAASTAYRTRVNLSGVLTSRGTTLTARDNVTVWRSSNGAAWSQDGTATYNVNTWSYEASRTVTAKTIFQLRYGGETMYQSAISNHVTLICRASFGRIWLSPSSPARRRSFVVYGYLVPRHSGYTRLYFYRLVRRRWVRFTSRNAANSNYLTYTRYKLVYKLPYAGRWYVRAFHSDGDHLATWSAAKYFTLR